MTEYYPRPLLRRKSFFSLDGEWMMNGQPIKVPYPPQAPLSGWKGDLSENLCYVRLFDLPTEFIHPGLRTILHIGAVDQTAKVYLNGQFICGHEGGYLPFEADITEHLQPAGNELRIDAEDKLLRIYPYGKQCKRPHGMWYTPVSGIWKSIWLEQVPAQFITSLKMTSDLSALTITVYASQSSGEAEIEIDGQFSFTAPVGQEIRIPIPHPHLWTPEDPYLYQLKVTLGGDCVYSYFALRTVSVINDRHGNPILALNGKPVFLNGLLDQGYFPNGLFLPDDPTEYDQEILRAKALGYNTLRKHIKIEPEAFYAACDRLGMLVIQDMVNAGPYHYVRDTVLPNIGFQHRPDFWPGDCRRKAFFEQHCRDIQDHLSGHPSVILYTIFNEGWGQYGTNRIYRMLKARDSSRLYISSSGWFKGYETDIDADHVYFKNKVITRKTRPLLLTECGGYTYQAAKPDTDHEAYGYGKTASPEELTQCIETLFREMVFPSIDQGLNGVIYTQLTDVEGEINGLYTYDRQTCKVLKDRLIALSEEAQMRFNKCVDMDMTSEV